MFTFALARFGWEVFFFSSARKSALLPLIGEGIGGVCGGSLLGKGKGWPLVLIALLIGGAALGTGTFGELIAFKLIGDGGSGACPPEEPCADKDFSGTMLLTGFGTIGSGSAGGLGFTVDPGGGGGLGGIVDPGGGGGLGGTAKPDGGVGLGGLLTFDCTFRDTFEVAPGGGGGLCNAHAKSDSMLEVNRHNHMGFDILTVGL